MSTIQTPKRKQSSLKSSMKLDGLIDIMHIVSQRPQYQAEILRQSKICMKKVGIQYVKFCEDNGFFSSYLVPRKGHGSKLEKNQSINRYYKHFRLTDKGHQFLDMFYVE